MDDVETAGAFSRIVLAREPQFTLGRLTVRPDRCQVELAGDARGVQPRTMQVLVALFKANGRVVSRV